MTRDFKSLIKRFSKVKILVVGDVMLDRYWWGSVERISPEAPVPVVRLEKTSEAAGGAANVAANIAGLGAKPYLIGIIGNDSEGRLLKGELEKQNVPAEFLVKLEGKPTIVKTRIVAHNQHVVRIDREESENLGKNQEEKLWKKFEPLLEETDLVLISDYAKGVLTENLLLRLITQANEKNKKVFVDPKGKDFSKYRNATILTPNKREAIDADKFTEGEKADLDKVGEDLINSLNLESMLITKGDKGMSLYRRKQKPIHLNSLARKVYDVTGAGDTVISSLAVAYAAGASLEEAAEIANVAAGLVVEEVGTTIITREKLIEHLY